MIKNRREMRNTTGKVRFPHANRGGGKKKNRA